ncbi:MAG TPA: M14 metallopeptidase family protein [Chitinophagaceae bacterium]|nr:M14 metallopeptidase family protein [Chitinophagaceae bacterium]
MIRKGFPFFLSLLFSFSAIAQLRSPEDFLGYKIGSHFTPHWKIMNYFNHVAANSPSMMKLQQYGQTNEGRPLLLAFISSASNINNLEPIRTNNLRLANLAKDKAAPVETNAPAIVWLSYNVHGDEASSSEAAMLVLYELVSPSSTRTKEWLKNTVVIIDPCINPDGRDRHVNWFNSVVGKNANPQTIAREQTPPWPDGRTNHYYFDLNRDWAWQTQVESKARIKMYKEWMPQVHADYHEMDYTSPYFFTPAAQPFHDVITPWQREFQLSLGKNHAKYFDEAGWLYFTKEYYDLYYPSYGDTWPTYNGAIGMTYEQGGNGAAIINEDGDTLTLDDRVQHHFTTSLSTIEVSSMNASRLVKEFRKFFADAVTNGVGEYKTYVIKNNPKDKERINALLELLDKNEIQYSSGSGQGKGYNYGTGKEESFVMNNDIVISSFQPRSAMVKVLFEPTGKLVDSSTYDITAWSLPYAYGLEAYASRERINSTGSLAPESKITNPNTNYGYIIPWTGVKTVKTVAELLQKGILLRYAEEPFEVNGNKFERGAMIVLKTTNRSFGNNLWAEVRRAADDNAVQLYPVASGFVDKGFDFGSDKVHSFKAPKVALLTGEGTNYTAVGQVWHFFENEIDYPVTLINVSDIGRVDWKAIDVLIMADGNYSFLSDSGTTGSFKSWINAGGKLIALEGAVNALSKAKIGLQQIVNEDEKKEQKADDALKLNKYGDRERSSISGNIPGSIYKVELDNTHPMAYGYPGYYYSLKTGDKIYEFIKENGWNVGVIRKDNLVAGFVGSRLKEKLKNGLLFGVQSMGKGTIISLTDNVLFRSFWENGKLMFCNAVFLVGQ